MKWEYKKVGVLDEKSMNALGRIGWELVAVIGDCNGSTHTMFFKRQIEEE